MKITQSKFYISALLVAGLLVAGDAKSQTRKLPDGTIVYSDGTKRLPNGTIIYKDGANNYPVDNRNDRGAVTLPDGGVIYPEGGNYPDRSDRYPDDERGNNKHYKHGHRNCMPPGQAKKVYGGNARDYAYGQQKKWEKHGHKHDKYDR